MPQPERSRDRVLTDQEIELVWREAGLSDFGGIVRLLLLTGQRAMEIGGLRWSEIGGSSLHIVAQRSKNNRAHDVPLSDSAASIIAGLGRRGERDLVFGSGAGPFSGWSRAKAALGARMLPVLKERYGSRAKLTPWRIHNLRRTAATRMVDLGVPPHVVEAVLNHLSGGRAGVAGTYNRSSYAAEKKAAMATWAARVEAIVGGTT